jgi:hypothetical protein
MKTFVGFVGSVLFTATLMLGANGSMVRTNSGEPVELTKKEAKTLEVSAKTREDHQKLATYYRQLAEHQREESAKQADLAAHYARNAIFSSNKFRTSTLDHSRYFAQKFQRDAQKLDDLAARHEALAGVRTETLVGN